MIKISKVLLITALISIALCSCTKEEIVLVGDYVPPVGSTKVEFADLSANKVYGYLKNQDGERFMAEFNIPDTLISGIEEAVIAGKDLVIKYLAINQEYVIDESGMFSEEHDIVLAEGNLEASYFEVVED